MAYQFVAIEHDVSHEQCRCIRGWTLCVTLVETAPEGAQGWSVLDGITTIRLRTFRLRHFVYYDFPCWNRSWSDETNTISIHV